jgi:hypothetical protein
MHTFHKNQQSAIEVSLRNNFESGVHFHATGTGKSWIALELLSQYRQRNPKNCNILWICEQKSILLDQFDTKTLESKGYGHILKQFFIFDYSKIKPRNWSSIVNSAAIWRKPILIIVNRAFLVSQAEYEGLAIPLHLLIHDECHSISNKTTQLFYETIQRTNPDVCCIGFSATPLLRPPFTKILSQYTIYDACRDGVIVPPRIVSFKSDTQIRPENIRKLCHTLFQTLPYQKIIVWCGMIQYCESAVTEWSRDPLFTDWLLTIDTSKSSDRTGYKEFYESKGRAILFCAGKHREGSDIPYLDGCVFLDNVAERNHKTFVQCVGRTLRRDPDAKKTHGLIIDMNARSPIELCNRMNEYLKPDIHTFPYRFLHRRICGVQVNILDVVSDPIPPPSVIVANREAALESYWRRRCPDNPEYKDRLTYELKLMYEKDVLSYVFHALDILELTHKIPHVTRGSCGSSLVCYLLGISTIDPVKYNIQFARFLNRYRTTLPDIDFDFPHALRDEVFLQIYLKWPNRVARISNHVYYHEKSALRKAVQLAGFRTRIPALQIRDFVRRLPVKKREFITKESKRLENTFRTYSLHCGGIVFYPDGVPSDLKLNTAVLNQIILNKDAVSKNKQFKIDILSSRALTQLFEAQKYKQIHFDAYIHDPETAALFARGDNIGITLAESPLMRQTLLALKPRSIDDIAKCLAIIRPAAASARYMSSEDAIIYDDDAITMIQKYIGCDMDEADHIRRLLTKASTDELKAYKLKQSVITKLEDLRKYSFCKSHAYSYAQLVWQLGYMKAHYPQDFWQATLRHAQSSYRKWVHLYEAKCVGVVVDKTTSASIYAKHRRQSIKAKTPADRVRKLGVWADDTSFYPGCYLNITPQTTELCGLIANSRTLSYGKIKTVILLVGYAPQKYVELKLTGKYMPVQSSIGVTVSSAKQTKTGYESEHYRFF